MDPSEVRDRPGGDVTRLLTALAAGQRDCLDELLPLVYRELHELAERSMKRERAGHTLQTTALVHEAYLKLVDQRLAQWRHRAHFFAVAAQIMRRLLIDHARARAAAKRGGRARAEEGQAPGRLEPVDPSEIPAPDRDDSLLALDEALVRLAEQDPQQARIVELRHFGGLTIDETAAVVGISPATVKRDWAMAKAWLHREVAPE